MNVYFGLTPQDLGLNKNLTAHTSLFNLKSRQVLRPLINSKNLTLLTLRLGTPIMGGCSPCKSASLLLLLFTVLEFKVDPPIGSKLLFIIFAALATAVETWTELFVLELVWIWLLELTRLDLMLIQVALEDSAKLRRLLPTWWFLEEEKRINYSFSNTTPVPRVVLIPL